MYTDEEGYTFTVYSSLYTDWGLTIEKDGKELFSNPHCLSNESYGHKAPDDMDYEEAEEKDALVPWTEKDWKECLKNEADTFLEAFIEAPGQ